ncbi:glycosyltransferase family 2 protein [Turicibacter sanguinis]|uniref:glycosyltransferase family 2 protein n=1 Tax=Turicibacter sanguinis TaxID=154288 RepID=UPI00232D0250|nr:glycosyltransferase family 2 protein [Turicibacter sanguinis]MDB8540854.1 glycosyltransferase family 2 protein [Turicibacter sanguinis]
MKPLLTVFTPAYNRAYTLSKCYESLKYQTNQSFNWLIIDDGSTDDTKELVTQWMAEGLLNITYHYQENQGMHGAHNTAYELIDTELNVCIDSDDYMPIDAVEKIVNYWSQHGSDSLAGFVGLDAFEDGTIIGTKLPVEVQSETLFNLYQKHGVRGDKKIVYRTDLTRDYPYPLFEGERYVGLAYKYYKIDQTHKLGLLNEVLCIVEYLPDGSSNSMWHQYRKNPKGFAFYRLENLKNPQASLSYKFKECVHYVSSCCLINNKSIFHENPQKFLTALASPLGYGLYRVILKKTSN